MLKTDQASFDTQLKQWLSDSRVKNSQQYDLQLSEGTPGQLSLGQQVAVKVGETVTPQGPIAQTQVVSVGTIVRATANRKGDGKIELQVAFEQSRIGKVDTAKSAAGRPPIESMSRQSTVQLTEGQMNVLHTTQVDGETLHLVVSVAKAKPGAASGAMVKDGQSNQSAAGFAGSSRAGSVPPPRRGGGGFGAPRATGGVPSRGGIPSRGGGRGGFWRRSWSSCRYDGATG